MLLLQFDALTVRNLKHIDGVPVEPLALQPTTGGPKNLPIVKSYLSDIEDEENAELSHKPHLVIVGGGWGVSRCTALTIHAY